MQTQELDELSLNTPPAKPKRNFWGQYKAYIEGLRDKGKIGREALLELASLVLAFLFARTTIVFGAMPLGIALLCAKKKRIVATGVGVALGMATLGMTGWVYGFVGLFAITLRLALSFPGKNRKILPDCERFFGELPELRIATAAVCGLVAGGYQLLAGGVSTASLLFLLSMALLCPIACGAFLATFEYAPTPEALLGKEDLPKMKKRHEVLWRLGMMVLAAATCFSLKGIDLFGISLSLCLAMATGLLFSKRIDALHGMLAGGICGAVVLPLYAPAFALPGLICGVLWPVGGFFALGLGIASGAVWSAFVGELSGFLSVFPELCVTATLMWPLLQRIGKETTLPATSQSPGLSSDAIRQASESHIDQSDMHMLKLSGALASLSKVYEAYVESVETSKEELCLSACMEACEKRCTSCEHHATCWQGEMPVGEHFVAQVADSLCVGEDIDHTAMPPKMKMCCPLPEALMEDMKQAVGQVFRDAHEKERAYPALEYDIAAAMLKDVVKRERSRKKEDSRLSLEAKKILRGFGIHAKQVLVLGQKEKRVLVKGMNKTPHEGLLPKIKREL
ncbi:MAG: hypothetical protein J6R42_00635, partial [Clostridia bacterium]|nr:hypothetical protein [Clostridia bacterium]